MFTNEPSQDRINDSIDDFVYRPRTQNCKFGKQEQTVEI